MIGVVDGIVVAKFSGPDEHGIHHCEYQSPKSKMIQVESSKRFRDLAWYLALLYPSIIWKG